MRFASIEAKVHDPEDRRELLRAFSKIACRIGGVKNTETAGAVICQIYPHKGFHKGENDDTFYLSGRWLDIDEADQVKALLDSFEAERGKK